MRFLVIVFAAFLVGTGLVIAEDAATLRKRTILSDALALQMQQSSEEISRKKEAAVTRASDVLELQFPTAIKRSETAIHKILRAIIETNFQLTVERLVDHLVNQFSDEQVDLLADACAQKHRGCQRSIELAAAIANECSMIALIKDQTVQDSIDSLFDKYSMQLRNLGVVLIDTTDFRRAMATAIDLSPDWNVAFCESLGG